MNTLQKASDLIPQITFKPLPPEEAARRQKQLEDFEERQRQGRIQDIMAGCGAWKRHLEFQPSFAGIWGGKFSMMEKKLGSGFLSAIVGLAGNGKTQIGVELMKVVMEKEQTAFFTTAVDFFTAIKGTYRKDSTEGEADVLLRYRKPWFLVIDEFGKRSESEWEMTQLFQVINHRYGDKSDTLLIDNRNKEEFLAGVGPSIASRMLETGGIIEANWESFRK